MRVLNAEECLMKVKKEGIRKIFEVRSREEVVKDEKYESLIVDGFSGCHIISQLMLANGNFCGFQIDLPMKSSVYSENSKIVTESIDDIDKWVKYIIASNDFIKRYRTSIHKYHWILSRDNCFVVMMCLPYSEEDILEGEVTI